MQLEEGLIMITKPIDVLKELHFLDSKSRYPNVPDYCRVTSRYTDKTANGLTKCIIDFIAFNGGQAERISNTGRPIDKRETYTDVVGSTRTIGRVEWVKGSGTNGTADISATIKGRSVKIEVKIGKDRQSHEQVKYQLKVENAGGLYYVAKDFDSFYCWYKSKFDSNGG